MIFLKDINPTVKDLIIRVLFRIYTYIRCIYVYDIPDMLTFDINLVEES